MAHNRPGPTKDEQRSAERRARRLARYDEVVALRESGMPRNRIAERMGLDRRTVIVWLAAGRFPERAERARRRHRLDAYAEYIYERYDTDLDNAAQLLCASSESVVIAVRTRRCRATSPISEARARGVHQVVLRAACGSDQSRGATPRLPRLVRLRASSGMPMPNRKS